MSSATSNTTTHSDIIEKYQTNITALINDISLASNLTSANVTSTTSSIQSKVDISVDTLAQDIKLAQNAVCTQYSKPGSCTNTTIKSCLNQQKIYAQALSTKALEDCYNASTVKTLGSYQSDILALESPVSVLGDICTQLHPLASDTVGMDNCMTYNIAYYRQMLNEAITNYNTEVESIENDVDACILNKKTSITNQSTTILNNVLHCTGTSVL